MSIKLNKRQQIAANLLGLGKRQKDVARFVGVSEETISRWKKNALFVAQTDKQTLRLCQELVSQRLQLVDRCHAALINALNCLETPEASKAQLALKYLSFAGADRGIYQKLETIGVQNQNNDEALVGFENVCKILDGLAAIKSIGNKISDSEYRKLVAQEIDGVI